MLAGEVLFAEVLVTPAGISKGCGCVIFRTVADDALFRVLGRSSETGWK